MYYFDYAYTGKGTTKVKTKSGTKVKKPLHAKIASTTSHAQHTIKITKTIFMKKSVCEIWQHAQLCRKASDLFWEAAHNYERKNARTAASQIIALPKELTVQQRIELAEALIKQFTDEFNFPYTAAIHNHVGEIGGQDQPHLHIMYCERSVDEHNRTAEQFLVAITTKTLPTVEHKDHTRRSR